MTIYTFNGQTGPIPLSQLDNNFALGGTYTPAGTGAVATTVQDKLRESVSVKDFGAVGDGVADDTIAIKAAIAAVQAGAQGNAGVLTTYTIRTVHFPKGVYKVTASLTPDVSQGVNFFQFEGEQSIIKASAGVTVFGGIGTQVSFKGLQFFDGAVALSVKTGNSDTAMIAVSNSVFIGQTTASITTDNNSNSTLLTVKDSKFVTSFSSPGGQVLNALTADTIVFEDCWVSARNDSNAAFYSSAILVLRNVFGVPVTSLTAWVDNYGSVLIDQSRFGGESSGAATIVRNYASATVGYPVTSNFVRMQNSHVYTNGPAIKFYAIPNQVVVSGNEGFVDTKAFYVDAGVSSSDLNNIGSNGSLFVVENNTLPLTPFVDYAQGSDKAIKGLPFASIGARPLMSSPATAADVLINSGGWTGGYGEFSSNTATLNNSVTDRFGVPAVKFTATANGQTFTYGFNTMLSGVGAGVRTLVVGVQVLTDHIIQVQLNASNSSAIYNLGKGDHVLNLPFYFDGTGPQAVSVTGGMANTAQIQFNRYVVYAGHRRVTDKRVLLEGSAAPSSGTWYAGDRVTNTTITVGQPKAWSYTTAGAWASEGNL